MQSKFVVVEVNSTPSTMSLVEYLVTHGFDKFAVVTDLCDHPSLKYKDGSQSPESPSTTVSTAAQHTPPRTAISTPTSMATPVPPANKPRISIDSIANALSKKTASPPEKMSTPPSLNASGHFSNNQLNHFTKMFEEQQKIVAKKEEDRQRAEIQRIILNATSLQNQFGIDRITPDFDDHTNSETVSKASSEDLKPDVNDSGIMAALEQPDFGLGSSLDDSIRASMQYLLSPALNLGHNLFGTGTSNGAKRKGQDPSTPAPKKHRWLPVDELEESRSSRGKNCGRVHCKATYKCALCGKPTTLNSTGSRWNLLRHVIMIHSEAKPYKCWNCDFTGIKSNVISHARQCGHRADDANDVTTDDMRTEWNSLLHQCFPDYVRAKERGWQPEEPSVPSTPVKTEPEMNIPGIKLES